MAQLSIITAPDPRLRAKSAPVEQVDDRIRRLMDDMLETMYQAPGIGLSAIQVGVPRRVVVVDVSRDDEPPAPLRLVDPVIVSTSAETEMVEEGCLSLPEHYAEVERSTAAVFDYLDHDGARRRLEAEGLLAVCLQHELDHLDGILFVDHLSPVRRSMILRKLAKARKLKAAGA